MHPKLVLKVEILFFFVAHHQRNLVDAGLLQLLDLALDEHFSAHAKGALGAVVRDGGKPAGKACGKNHGVFDPVGLEGL